MTFDVTAARSQVLKSPEPQVIAEYQGDSGGQGDEIRLSRSSFPLCSSELGLASHWVGEFTIVTDGATVAH